MINDYISIDIAKVIDLEFEISIVIEINTSQSEIITNVIDQISTYMKPGNRDLGQNVNVSDIRKLIQNTAGVVTLADLKVYNRVGGLYSSSETSQRYSDKETREIELVDDTIFAEPDQIYQIRFDSRDINIRVKQLQTTDFS
jgi:hypothetical protein